MARTSSLAALVATVLLVIAAPAALADDGDTGASVGQSAAAGTAPPAADEAIVSSGASGGVEQETSDDETTAADVLAESPAGEPAAPAEPEGTPSPEPEITGSSEPETTASSEPPPAGEPVPTEPASESIGDSSAAGPVTAPEAPPASIVFETAAPSPQPVTGGMISPVAPQAPAKLVPPAQGSAPVRAPAWSPLGELLPRLDHQLTNIQSQIDDLQRTLTKGLLAPTDRLLQLGTSLRELAPALLALTTQLHSLDQLSPRLRRLLRRVTARLGRVRASAADLSVALRRSGLRGPEVRLLLRELEAFQDLRLGLAVDVSAAPGPQPAPLEQSLAAQPPPVAAPPQPIAAAPEVGRPGRPTVEPPGRDGGDFHAPASPAPGSAVLSPGGAFSAMGMVALAALLLGVAISLLRTRLALPPGRGYAVAFLMPLERPG